MRDYSRKNTRDPEEFRCDAIANRKVIVQVAQHMFATHGPDIPLTEIAREAGVSRTTFYRNFSDRQSLVAAVFHANLDLLEKHALQFEGDPAAFFRLLEIMVNQLVEFQSLIPYVPRKDSAPQERLLSIFRVPVRSARQQGLLRYDFNPEKDLILLLTMMGGALSNFEGVKQKSNAKRALQLLVQGIRNT